MTQRWRWSLISLLVALPAWGHGVDSEGLLRPVGDLSESVASGLLTALSLGVVLILAYGVSWAVARPIVGKEQGDEQADVLRLQNWWLKAAIDRITEPIVVVDCRGRLVLANRALEARGGGEELLNCHGMQRTIDRVLASGIGAQGWVEHPAGPVNVEVSPVMDRGDVMGVVAVCGEVEACAEEERAGLLKGGALTVDQMRREAYLQGRRLDLTATEFRLLSFLVEHQGDAHSRQTLLNRVWGYEVDGYSRTVDTHIRRLREKLGDQSRYLETIRGVGYRFRPHADEIEGEEE